MVRISTVWRFCVVAPMGADAIASMRRWESTMRWASEAIALPRSVSSSLGPPRVNRGVPSSFSSALRAEDTPCCDMKCCFAVRETEPCSATDKNNSSDSMRIRPP